jgi:PA14 domain/Bacterial Ig-like domain/GLEYA domain
VKGLYPIRFRVAVRTPGDIQIPSSSALQTSMKTQTLAQKYLLVWPCALLLLLGTWGAHAAAIVQGTGANYVAWEAENNVSIETTPSVAPTVTWTKSPDATASGASGLTSTGTAADTGTARAFARWTLVFNAPGTYQLYLRYRCNNDLGGQNSYRFPASFGATPDLSKVSQANQQGNPTTFTYIVGGERNQNTADQARYTVNPGDVGLPLTFTIGTRESGFEIDRFVLSTDLALDEAGFNALVNSGTFSFSSQPVNQTAVAGGSATFSAAVDQGTAPYSYQWYVNGVLDPAGTSASYTVSGLAVSDTGKKYKVVATDATATSITSREARLAVADPSSIVSVNFVGRGDGATDCLPGCSTLTAGETAGVVPLANWNNVDNSLVFNGVTGPLNNANGTATAITLFYDANDSWNNDTAAPATPTPKLYKGISKANGANRQNIYTFQNLADGYYDLIVNLNVNGDQRIGDIGVPEQSVGRVGGTTFFFTSEHRFAGSFIQGSSSSSTVPRDFCNFVRFTASPDASHNLVVSFINRGDPDGIGIAGFQLAPAGTEAIAITSQPASYATGNGSPFSFSVGVSGSGPYTIQWYKDGVAIPGANSLTYSGTANLGLNGAKYSASVANSIPSSATSTEATLTVADVPVLLAAGSLDSFSKVCVRFNKPLNADGANVGHYSISGGVTISSAAFSPSDPSVVVLQTSPLASAVTYTLTVTGVQDNDSNTIFPNPSTIQFTPGGYAPVRITYRQYRNITGGVVDNLRASPRFPNSPDYVEYNTPLLEYPQTSGKPYGDKNDFGAVISGYYIAPASGNYQFGVAADDGNELWLSSDANPANKVKIAGFNDWTNERNYITRSDGFAIPASAISGLIPLVAGHVYYIEGLYKEGGGGDHIEVAVRRPGDAAIANGTTSIPIDQFAPDPSGKSVFNGNVYNPGDVAITSQPAGAHVVEGTTVNFTVGIDGTPPYSIVWYDNGVAIPNSNSGTLSIFATPSNNGHTYHAVVKNLCSSATTADALLEVDIDTAIPTVVEAGCDPIDKKIRVTFSEPVTSASATALGNYGIDSGLTIDAAQLLSDNKTVLLTTSDVLVPNQLYSLTIQGVTDRSISANVMDPATMPITGCICSNGVILVELFRGDNGPNNFQTLTNNSKFPNNPDNLYFLNSANWGQTPNAYFLGQEDNYGLRMRGYVVPDTTGNYQFAVHADDSGFLALSTDSNPAKLQQLINAQGDCGACNPAPNGVVSPTVTLNAGQAYYFEAMFQEGGGGDYLELRWKLGNGAFAIIPSSNLRYCYDPQTTVLQVSGLADQTIEACRPFTISPTYTITPGQGVITYQWMREFIDIAGATSPTYTIPHVSDSDNAASFQVRVSALLREVVSDSVFLTVLPDTDVPTIVKASADITRHRVIVSFSEEMDPSTASDASLYSVVGPGGPLTLTAGTVSKGSNVVLTTFETIEEGADYTVTIQGGPILDLCQVQVANVGDSASFKLLFVPGLITFKTYETGAGNAVSMLTASPLYPDSPRESLYITAIDTRLAYPNDNHEAYGGQLEGFIVPPISGNFIFYLNSDDASEFWLNKDGPDTQDITGSVKIVEEITCCENPSVHSSAPIPLVAGQRYYFKGLWKEGVGGDYMQVRAKLAADPADPNGLVPVGPDYVGTYVDSALIPALAPTLPTSGMLPIGSLARRGFDVHTVQVGTNIDNLLGIAEQLLAGGGGPNLSQLPFSLESGVINYSIEISSYGSIPNDKPFPGIPGTTASTDNIAMEALTYVELHQGFHSFVVNSDDGFRVTPALCVADPNNALVLGAFEGGRGASDTPFVFYVPTDGLYPMRLIWEQGGGGANVEWVDVRQGTYPTRVAVNGDNNIKAFSASQFTAVRSGNDLIVSWNSTVDCPYRLQMTDVLQTPSSATVWTDVPGGSPASVPIGSGNAFFRLIRP